jgi:hypothetical protein
MMRACTLVIAMCSCWTGGTNTESTTPAPIENKQPAPRRAPPPTRIEAAMMAMEGFERDMCACGTSNPECAKEVSDAMVKWSQEQARNTDEPIQMTDADQQRAMKIGTHMGECMQNAMQP